MRKLLLVVVVVGAAFLGGAVANGPGFAPTRELVRKHASGALAYFRPGDATSADGEAPVVDEGISAAPLPPLPGSGTATTTRAGNEPAPGEAKPPSELTSPRDQPAPPAETAAASPTESTAPDLGPPKGTDAAPKAPEAAPERTVAAAKPPTADAVPPREPATTVAAQPSPTPKPAAEPATQAGRGWDDAPGSAPAAPVFPSSGRPDVGTKPPVDPAVATKPPVDPAVKPAVLEATPAAAPPSKGWADMRRRLHALGVSRYWVEGEPNGPVRFRCVIPQAGQHAVGQQFEAEGDDELHAAEAAVKRIALWKATEMP